MLCLSAAERRVGILRAVCLAGNETLVSWFWRLGAESRDYCEGTIELDLHVERSLGLSSSRGSAAERFTNVLDYLGRMLAGAREKLRSPGVQTESQAAASRRLD